RAGDDLADAARAHASCPSACGSAPGSIVRISKMEIIGRKRMKSASRKRKSPIEPRYIAQSQIVPWYMPHDDGRKSRESEVGMMTKRSSHMPTFTNMAVTKSPRGLVRMRLNHISCGARPLQTISATYMCL